MIPKFRLLIAVVTSITLIALITALNSFALVKAKTPTAHMNWISYRINWKGKTSMPTPRWNAGVTIGTKGKIYVLGGTDGSSSTITLATVEEYDPSTDTWTERADMPAAYQGVSAVGADNGKIYAFGGSYWYSEFGLPGEWWYSADVEEYDPMTDTWSKKANMPHPRAYAAAAKGNNGKIYIFGGINNSYMSCPYYCQNDVEEYDPSNDTWSSKAYMPTLRLIASAALATSGKIYVIGGEQSPWYGSLNTVEEYDPSTDTWQSRAGLPTARSGLAAVGASNGRIYVIGGKGNNIHNMTNTVEEYNPDTNNWITRQSMIKPRWLFGAAITDEDKIYIIGGNDNCCNEPLGNNEEGQIISFEVIPGYLPIIVNH
jgi:N-acetylneuraminic acid mutarotase